MDPPVFAELLDGGVDRLKESPREGSWSQIPNMLRRVNVLRVPRSSRCRHAAVGILKAESGRTVKTTFDGFELGGAT